MLINYDTQFFFHVQGGDISTPCQSALFPPPLWRAQSPSKRRGWTNAGAQHTVNQSFYVLRSVHHCSLFLVEHPVLVMCGCLYTPGILVMGQLWRALIWKGTKACFGHPNQISVGGHNLYTLMIRVTKPQWGTVDTLVKYWIFDNAIISTITNKLLLSEGKKR